MKSSLVGLAAGLLIVALVSGCGRPANETSGPGESAARSAKPGRLIGLSVLTMNNPFFKEIADTMAAEGAKQGYEVLAVSGDNDPAKQQNQVKDFIVKKAVAIVLCPCDSRAIAPAIREATAAGIPVFTADIACLDPGAGVVTHVATDNLQGGRMAADAMVEAIGGKGQVAILDYPEVESVILRTKGFHQRLDELNRQPGVKVEVVAALPGGGERAKSFKAMQDILQAHPSLSGVFAVNDPSALGARAALESAGKAEAVKIVGFDGQPDGKRAIRDGKIYADPIQFPDKIGRQSLEVILRYFNGEEPPKQILIPTALYRQSDAAQDGSLK
jgi:ribose transport system substrate-binding protein